jgi:predicted CopG family antitoxin
MAENGLSPPGTLTAGLCNVHIARMSTKTISLKHEAYERLRAARRYAGESFSEVVLRARWPEDTETARELLARYARGARLTAATIDRVETLKKRDRPPGDKWAGR